MNVRLVGRSFAYLVLKQAGLGDVPPDQVENVLRDQLKAAKQAVKQ
jgi:hypothetical protein